MFLKPSDIFYSQDSISNRFGEQGCHGGQRIHTTFEDICDGRCSVYDIPTIRVVNLEGRWVTIDNRRLWVFRRLERFGICDEVPVKLASFIYEDKLTSCNGGTEIEVRSSHGDQYEDTDDELDDDSDDDSDDDDYPYYEQYDSDSEIEDNIENEEYEYGNTCYNELLHTNYYETIVQPFYIPTLPTIQEYPDYENNCPDSESEDIEYEQDDDKGDFAYGQDVVDLSNEHGIDHDDYQHDGHDFESEYYEYEHNYDSDYDEDDLEDDEETEELSNDRGYLHLDDNDHEGVDQENSEHTLCAPTYYQSCIDNDHEHTDGTYEDQLRKRDDSEFEQVDSDHEQEEFDNEHYGHGYEPEDPDLESEDYEHNNESDVSNDRQNKPKLDREVSMYGFKDSDYTLDEVPGYDKDECPDYIQQYTAYDQCNDSDNHVYDHIDEQDAHQSIGEQYRDPYNKDEDDEEQVSDHDKHRENEFGCEQGADQTLGQQYPAPYNKNENNNEENSNHEKQQENGPDCDQNADQTVGEQYTDPCIKRNNDEEEGNNREKQRDNGFGFEKDADQNIGEQNLDPCNMDEYDDDEQTNHEKLRDDASGYESEELYYDACCYLDGDSDSELNHSQDDEEFYDLD